ncbi:MAG: gamma-glutamyltransferase [Steroidobacteraceae bacterium]
MNRLATRRPGLAAGAVALLVAAMVLGARPLPAIASPPPRQAAIASAHPEATAAGEEILNRGGNAFDAAIAVAAALAVVEPSGSGLGGGGFLLLHRASDDFDVMIDAREKAPAAATRDMFLDADGVPVPGLSKNSALAAGIPGEPAALAHLAKHYGRLPLAATLAPAIRLARQGFAMYPRLRGGIAIKRDVLLRSRELSRNFLDRGAVPANGFIVRQPQLAATLERLAARGMDDFYRGALSRELITKVRRMGGIWSAEDLAGYQVVEREPVVGNYRGARVVAASLPSSGGIVLIDALNILSGYDLGALDGASRKHLILEAERRAHRDRAVYLGDPDFVDVPVAQLIHPYYAAGQRSSIRLDRALPSSALPGVAEAGEAGTQTTHFSILDKEGNRAAVTITLNFWFGSGLVVPGTGILLNNEMDDFSIKPGVPNGFDLVGGDANAIAPGKRMLSSSTPAFVESRQGLMILGSPGGSFIPGMVLNATLDFLDGRSAEQIVAAPRIHHQYLPDRVLYEQGALSDAEIAALTDRGHKLEPSSRRWGNLQVITQNFANGEVQAAADPRGDGAGHVY